MYFRCMRFILWNLRIPTSNNNQRTVCNINTKRLKLDENETRIWQFHLGHISVKRLSALHKCGLLSQFEFDQIGRCEACLMGKMTVTPQFRYRPNPGRELKER